MVSPTLRFTPSDHVWGTHALNLYRIPSFGPSPSCGHTQIPALSMETKRNSGLLCPQKATGARRLTQAVASRGHHQIPASHMTVNILLITSSSNSCPTPGGNRTQHGRHVPSRPSGQPCPGSSITSILNQGPRQPAFPRLLGADDHSTLNKKKKNIPHGYTSFCRTLTRPTQVPSKKKHKKLKAKCSPSQTSGTPAGGTQRSSREGSHISNFSPRSGNCNTRETVRNEPKGWGGTQLKEACLFSWRTEAISKREDASPLTNNSNNIKKKN